MMQPMSMKALSQQLNTQLCIGLTDLNKQLEGKNIERCKKDLLVFIKDQNSSENELPAIMVTFLITELKHQLETLDRQQIYYQSFLTNSRNSATELERRNYILQFASQLGATQKQLRGDKKSFKRYFGADAISERYARLNKDNEHYITFILDRLAHITSDWFTELSILEIKQNWRQIQLEPLLVKMLTHFQEDRLKHATFKCLSFIIRRLKGNSADYLGSSTIRYVYRFAQDYRQPIWTQVEAAALIAEIEPQSLLSIAQRHFNSAQESAQKNAGISLKDSAKGDDLIFLRRHLLSIIADHNNAHPALLSIIPLAMNDPSEFVRQGLVNILPSLPDDLVSQLIIQLSEDQTEQVRASLVLQLPLLAKQAALSEICSQLMLNFLHAQQPLFVLRTTLITTVDFFRSINKSTGLNVTEENITEESLAAQPIYQQLMAAISDLHTQHSATKVRRWAANAREQLWATVYKICRESEFSAAQDQCQKPSLAEPAIDSLCLGDLPLGKSRRLPKAITKHLTSEMQARLLAVQAQDGFGFDISANKIIRDHKVKFRLWRFIHELRNSATDKRQNYSHMTGRVYYGEQHIPSTIVSERSATKVPGEPLFQDDEEGWRPYLPLVDQVISAIDQNWPTKAIKIITSEGITWLTPPNSLWQRLTARATLVWHFKSFAQLRNWSEGDAEAPDAYLKSLVDLGFTIELTPHTDHNQTAFKLDQQVQRFFPVFFPPWFIDGWRQFEDYFFSVYQNSLNHLLLFCSGLSLLFFGSHLGANWQMRRARAKIPLVIGGWGTRGKSGTERLKAALFNAMGYHVVSKTSGCEAMFLHGTALQPLHEMFLFRPYDKATIWEQAQVVTLSEKLGADVFLWECMGLTPRYIEILQQQWMCDDIATITNCYPDHEDIQGPAGVDIPKVMQKFVPKKSILITSEENMRPFLDDAAREKETELHKINWLDAGLLTNDVLNRFPYEEHPYNIALVIKLGALLNLPAEYCLKEMADRVVPDLGVLKIYPLAEVNGRYLSFINGMSANERFGTLSNWQRVGFNDTHLDEQPNIWITTVVNNRADRIARSQVFAQLLVEDIGADKHFLIGSNLDGLQNYIDAAWDNYIDELSIADESIEHELSKQKIITTFGQIAKRLRVPSSQQQVNQRLVAMLKGIGLNTDASPAIAVERTEQQIQQLINKLNDSEVVEENKYSILQQWQQDNAELAAINSLSESLNSANKSELAALIITCQQQLASWFKARFVVVSEFYTSGNQLITLIANHTPAGLTNRIMGLQNIKGTGLDFVYRWQAWDRTHSLCEQLNADDEIIAKSAVSELARIQDFGPLDQHKILSSVEAVKHKSIAQTEQFQAELELIDDNLIRYSQDGQVKSDNEQHRFTLVMIDFIEALLDPGQAIKRKKAANQIYQDLADERISHARAAIELQTLNKKQKGGWLRKALNNNLKRA
jgi:poly-gamma-glutamate synthase PgsB/CapB